MNWPGATIALGLAGVAWMTMPYGLVIVALLGVLFWKS